MARYPQLLTPGLSSGYSLHLDRPPPSHTSFFICRMLSASKAQNKGHLLQEALGCSLQREALQVLRRFIQDAQKSPLLNPSLPCRLSWNLLGDEAAAELARVLPQMGRLKRMEYDGHIWGSQKGVRGPKGALCPGESQEATGSGPCLQEALLDFPTLSISSPVSQSSAFSLDC